MPTTRCTVSVADVRRALDAVRDPELDEAITDLDFVQGITIHLPDASDSEAAEEGPTVTVELRLPTYFCAPNFAYLMVADAYEALKALDGVANVRIRLLDHFASDEINAGIATGEGFTGTFPDLADGDLTELRVTFQRKAHQASQELVASGLLRHGWVVTELAEATLADAVEVTGYDRLLRRRADLGLPSGPESALLVDEDGRRIGLDQLPVRLRFARTTRISIEGNAGLCRGLLNVRYNLSTPA
jgi:metal-sulfur cluster biosynthetic enzyme